MIVILMGVALIVTTPHKRNKDVKSTFLSNWHYTPLVIQIVVSREKNLFILCLLLMYLIWKWQTLLKLGECVKVGYHNQSTYFGGATTPRATSSPSLGILATVI